MNTSARRAEVNSRRSRRPAARLTRLPSFQTLDEAADPLDRLDDVFGAGGVAAADESFAAGAECRSRHHRHPFRPEQFTALLDRATEPEYGPVIAVSTAAGLRALPFANIEYLECTHHVVHFHLATGEDVPSLSLRVPFAEVAKPLLADDRFLQPHRSYVVNLAAAEQLAAGEFRMRSGARVPIPRGKEAAVRARFKAWMEQNL